MKVLVVTPTIGDRNLANGIISVRAQSFREIDGVDVLHVIVVDGEEHKSKVMDALSVAQEVFKNPSFDVQHKLVVWPYNTGGQGFYGHKIYAAASQLVTPDIDWVMFLDQDNWFEPNHMESVILKASLEGLDFSFSLRKFYTDNGVFYANDNCSSLGPWKAWEEKLGGRNLVDTGCYCFRGSFISEKGHIWNMKWGADITFFESVMATARYGTTGERTFCYRLASVGHPKYEEEKKFIDRWNAYAEKRYGGKYPWEK